MSGAETRPRATAIGLARYSAPTQVRVRAAWADPEVSRGDLLQRFAMPESTFARLMVELGPRPRLIFRPATTLTDALRRHARR